LNVLTAFPDLKIGSDKFFLALRLGVFARYFFRRLSIRSRFPERSGIPLSPLYLPIPSLSPSLLTSVTESSLRLGRAKLLVSY